MTIHHLLVPIDGSDPANRAVQYAIDLAAQTKARITFCFAVDSQAFYGDVAATGGYDVQPLIEEERRKGREVLAHAAQLAASGGTSCETKLEEGSPRDVILRLERELTPDLLVMGTHGRRGLGRLFLGSTTEDVLRRSIVPVLAVPPAQPEPSEEKPAQGTAEQMPGAASVGWTF
jgi:nucleotide-binding universal stress UspA family protein